VAAHIMSTKAQSDQTKTERQGKVLHDLVQTKLQCNC
jgi:hypothetical protein